jgi:iron complex transport system ATP-binding protein
MIRIDGLTCGYGAKVVLNDIDLEIARGEFAGIIGPNGSGKTTLLKTITRVIKPVSGNIYLEGKNIHKLDIKEVARKIAVVSQNVPSMAMTVREFVLLGRVPYYKNLQLFESKTDIVIVEKAVKMTGIVKFEDRYVSEISGGEAQLASIARALVQEPSLLLLDEPTAHLDIAHQVSILDLIKRLNRQHGLTVIIVLHDLNLASEYCDRLILMDKGRVRSAGTPERVLNYRDIEEVYETSVVVDKNPLSSKPFVLIIAEEVRQRSANDSNSHSG